MNLRRPAALLLVPALVLLSACNSPSPGATPSAPASPLANVIDHALDQASAKLNTHNMTLDDDHGRVPDAAITPQGDLLIAGKPVALTPAQRSDVLAYRQQLIDTGQAGLAVGKQGAQLGAHAASEAIAGALSGQSSAQIRARVEAQATGVREAAVRICDLLPAMLDSQQKLATAVPAFKPYATLTPAKIDKCRKDALHDTDD